MKPKDLLEHLEKGNRTMEHLDGMGTGYSPRTHDNVLTTQQVGGIYRAMDDATNIWNAGLAGSFAMSTAQMYSQQRNQQTRR